MHTVCLCLFDTGITYVYSSDIVYIRYLVRIAFSEILRKDIRRDGHVKTISLDYGFICTLQTFQFVIFLHLMRSLGDA